MTPTLTDPATLTSRAAADLATAFTNDFHSFHITNRNDHSVTIEHENRLTSITLTEYDLYSFDPTYGDKLLDQGWEWTVSHRRYLDSPQTILTEDSCSIDDPDHLLGALRQIGELYS